MEHGDADRDHWLVVVEITARENECTADEREEMITFICNELEVYHKVRQETGIEEIDKWLK